MAAAASLPEALAGVGTTAIGVALIRARETGRDDRLYEDPFAQAFADVARDAFLAPSAPSGSADTWATVRRLVDVFYEGRTLATRFFDGCLLDAVTAGCEQVVLLGAGLDTRAFRLAWPRQIDLFEVDLPEMFAFKEQVLNARAAAPACRRAVVPTDLREDWRAALYGAGFRDGVPTAWVAEGLLGYLPRDAARRVLTTVGAMSVPGSRFACEHIRPDTPGLEGIRELLGREETARPAGGLGPDAPEWLEGQGWRTRFAANDDLAASYGRPPSGGPHNGYLSAERA
ncbi:SAM-dependent methyltransferase [Streptomyces sp. NBC_01803]|uniref:SAM-dependent methyltransferase n=1 Tax=Streptomyces sp. NBC_01803 TaxID=2975946 RepID=UPI002DDAC862|nr:SAM-dependent methyltransferase [Streptomyces sp. NBC_01803]WSA46283.1 SAM-dependent methyltransferase [Streptomyces sp. NBC_01803]